MEYVWMLLLVTWTGTEVIGPYSQKGCSDVLLEWNRQFLEEEFKVTLKCLKTPMVKEVSE